MSFYQDHNDKLAFEQWNTRSRPHYAHISVTPISPALGAEVTGVNLKEPLSSEQLAELRTAIADNLVLVFRDQPIDREEHKAFAHHFGTLHQHVLAADDRWGQTKKDPEIRGWVTNRESRFTAGEVWHSDATCDEEPIWSSLLRTPCQPEIGGGDTAFSNLYLAYESLSAPIKGLLEGLTAIHDAHEGWSNGYGTSPAAGTHYPVSEHPVVVRHPLSGRKILFVNAAFTTHIVQLSRAESDALLRFLFRHIERHLSFQTRIHWMPGSLLFWDNWATQHHAVWDYYPFERSGERVSVLLGHRPLAA